MPTGPRPQPRHRDRPNRTRKHRMICVDAKGGCEQWTTRSRSRLQFRRDRRSLLLLDLANITFCITRRVFEGTLTGTVSATPVGYVEERVKSRPATTKKMP